ncbi:discoidin domain-containing protein [Paenibacillus arenosi]|uniref:Discoidin domain-containing protein n=1 Tax=Paenibacillus arenosi TaxID=2774142 RepID=A0ABR9AX90_9BACL|nr:discoidin domain-containing protein [Paenibacillus arenosi]MBD8497827.1 discoidin domain-containing protein [Paenibacillus arenosi]
MIEDREKGDGMNHYLFYRRSHLNCYRISVAHLLLRYGHQAEHLFYNSYESSDNLYKELLEEKKGFWLLNMECLEDADLLQVGVKFTDFEGSSTSEAVRFIEMNLHDKHVVFAGLKPKYFPELHFMDGESTHYMMIEQFVNQEHAVLNDIRHVASERYDSEFVLNVVSQLEYPLFSMHVHNIEFTAESKQLFLDRAIQQIMKETGSSRLFDKAVEMVNQLPYVTTEERKDIFHTLIQLFVVLGGSRYMFSSYVNLLQVPSYVSPMLHYCSDLAEGLKNVIIKKEAQIHILKQPVQIDDLLERVAGLREYERLTLLALKKEIAQDAEASSWNKPEQLAAGPSQLRALAITSDSIAIEWEAPMLEDHVIAFEITINDMMVETRVTRYKFQNVKPDTDYRIVVRSKDIFGNVSQLQAEIEIRTEPSILGEDWALNKMVSASSVEPGFDGMTFPANHVVNGNSSTRWSSEFSEPQWLCIDLEERVAVSHVVVQWEYSFATKYEIQVSDDSETWVTISTKEKERREGEEEVEVSEEVIVCHGEGRYVRILMLERETTYGFSIWNVNVYGQKVESESLCKV